MLFRKRKKGPFAHLDPNQGPGIEEDIRSKSTDNEELRPVLFSCQSRDNHQLDLVAFSIKQTYPNPVRGTPWSATVDFLQNKLPKGAHLLPFHFVRQQVEIPDLAPLYTSLPPFTLNLTFFSESFVPDEDDACYGSVADVIWFSETVSKWQDKLASVLRDSLDWQDVAKPAFREPS